MFPKLITVVVALAAAIAVLAGCEQEEMKQPAGVGTEASAAMIGPDGTDMGTVKLVQGPRGVLVSADLRGLSPGFHGFHIHTTGSCSPDFSAAGDHFNPGDVGHGYMNEDGMHAGDLPNIYAGSDGIARADYFTADITLATGEGTSVFDTDGSAIIVHEKPDTYGAEAGAGGRVACGVIEGR